LAALYPRSGKITYQMVSDARGRPQRPVSVRIQT
jgi:hypothetical protein